MNKIAVSLVAIMVGCGFSTPSIPNLSPLFSTEEKLRNAAGSLGPEDIAHDASQTKEQCVSYLNTVSHNLGKGKDKIISAKGITGILTGALSGTAGVGAGIVSFAQDQQTATHALALTSAGIGVVGALLVGLIAPGANEVEQHQVNLISIKAELDKLDSITLTPNWHNDAATIAKVRQILPTLRGLCKTPGA